MLILLLVIPLASAIPIDNGLDGEPEVQCGPTTLQVAFRSRNPFVGVVYAKNHHSEGGCSTIGDGSVAGGGIELAFDACNVKRQRSLNPKGVFVSMTIVVQFHPFVLTKVDRAFRLECFYMEADKTVDQELEVSMITTELRTFVVPMPVCRYDILENDADGQPIRFVTIGMKIYHKWTCDTETTDTFCMIVYGCYVDDGSGPNSLSTIELVDDDGCSIDKNLLDNLDYPTGQFQPTFCMIVYGCYVDDGSGPNSLSTIELVDDDGCSIDKNLLDNLDYPTDLMAGQQSHVFKYADRPQLYFNCQIRIAVKEPDNQCQRPSCPDPLTSFGRKKRSRPSDSSFGELDVFPRHPLYVADVELTQNDSPAAQGAASEAEVSGLCLSGNFLGAIFGLCGVFGVATISLSAIHLARYASRD